MQGGHRSGSRYLYIYIYLLCWREKKSCDMLTSSCGTGVSVTSLCVHRSPTRRNFLVSCGCPWREGVGAADEELLLLERATTGVADFAAEPPSLWDDE